MTDVRWISTIRLRIRSLLRRGQVERELDEEVQFHLDHIVDDYVAAGMAPEEARYQALRDMGAIAQSKDACRDARGLALIDSLRQDVAYAARALRKSPAFSAVAILSLAIGIGANTTIFSFVNAALLIPLRYPDPDRLVVLHEHAAGSADPLSVHPANFVEWRARARAFEALALAQTPPLNVMGANGVEQVARLSATPDLFRVFRIEPFLGRGFTDDDGRRGSPPVVVLGHGFWQRWFAADRGVLGRPLAAQDGSPTIVGVAPAGFRIGGIEPDVITPITIDPANPAATGSRAFQCFGRLKPGVTLAAARAEMGALAAVLGRQSRTSEGMGVLVSDLHEYLVRGAVPGLRLLMAAVMITLAIACVNVAGLLLARGVSRRGELAVRAALGASRQRLVRQLVVESLVLSVCAGAAGLAFASWATPALAALGANALVAAGSEPVRLDVTCLLFTFAVSSATALMFGLVPAWQSARVDPQSALRERTRAATADRAHHRTRAVLVTAQLALAVVLLVGAGLLLRTLSSLGRVDLGFQPAESVTMGLFLGDRPANVRIAVLDRILERIESLPGVKAAGTIQFLPLRGATCGTGFWREDAAARQNPAAALPAECALVSRGYFAAMGIPVLDGRPFDRQDRLSSPRVVMVSRSFARRYFPDGRAIGSRVLVQSSNQALAEIVGVAGDVRQNGLTSNPSPTVYLLHAQTPGYITNLVVRTSGDPLAYATAIRRAIHAADPTQAVSSVRALEQDVASALARPTLYASLVAGFAAVAVVLAAIGIYGLIAYVVNQRTQEIGIRLALGASRERVFADLLGQGGRLVGAGVILGVAAASALRQTVSTMVFGVTPGDVPTYAVATLAFLTVSFAAVVIPARRASKVEPTRALRGE
jgi:predicted permease